MEVTPALFRNMAQVARARAGMTNTTGQVLTLLKLLIGRRQSGDGAQDYFDIDWDLSDETCSRLFFATGGMVASFKRHAQFFTLDATCKTNRFNMPLVLLVGMDDTMKTTIFGMALVLSESIDSYVWVLQCFRKAVGWCALQSHHPCHSFRATTVSLRCHVMVTPWCQEMVSYRCHGGTIVASSSDTMVGRR